MLAIASIAAAIPVAHGQGSFTAFENGNIIDANEVNANFTYLKTLMDAAGVTIDDIDLRLSALED